MNRPLPECCKEFQITNRDEFIKCLEAFRYTRGIPIEVLREKQHYLDEIHGADHGIMFFGDQDLEDLYNQTGTVIHNRMDELRKLRTTELRANISAEEKLPRDERG